MKIDPNNEISKNSFSEKAVGDELPQESTFKKVLQEAIEGSSGTDEQIQTAPIINSICEIDFSSSFTESLPVDVKRIENFLDLLEDYQQRLSYQHIELKDLCPLVDKVEMERVALISVLDSIPEGDPLKDILSQALITSSIEIIKFLRGDYAVS